MGFNILSKKNWELKTEITPAVENSPGWGEPKEREWW